VTKAKLTEQQKIADAFLAEHLLPRKLDTLALRIWAPD
jgi:sulfonate transport system substrate-binding protein